MNYLEQLVSEWYQYQGYFVKTNVRITDERAKSTKHELDVIAYNYKTKEFVHIEASTSTNKSGDIKRVERFKKANYAKIFEGIKLHKKPTKRVIFLHYRTNTRIYQDNNIHAISISQFLYEINAVLEHTSIGNSIVPESFPLIRTIQIVLEEIRKEKTKKY